MKRLKFLAKLIKEGKLKIVESSDELTQSYLEKSNNCLKSAKILLPHNLYENTIINTYYVMYNSLLALLFKIGIKSDNHTASIIFLEEFLNEKELSKTILEAKDERIEKQYYIESDSQSNKESVKKLITKSEDFIITYLLLKLLNVLSNVPSIFNC